MTCSRRVSRALMMRAAAGEMRYRRVKPPGAMASARAAPSTARLRGLFTSMPPTRVAAGLGGGGQGVEPTVGDEAGIDAVQRRAELLHHLLQAGDDGRELLQRLAAAQVLGVAGEGFEPQDAFAFGIALQGQVPEVDLEFGQVIRRCLDRDLQPRRPPAPRGPRAHLGAGQRAHLADIQPGPRPVHHGVKDVLHLPAGGKQQVAAVFGLVDRVGVGEESPLLVGQVQAEDQAGGVDPPVDDLAQPLTTGSAPAAGCQALPDVPGGRDRALDPVTMQPGYCHAETCVAYSVSSSNGTATLNG
jgi:hypothetical protein